MIIVKLILAAIILPITLGYISIYMISRKDDLKFFEALSLSYGIGVGLLSFIMFLMGWALIPLRVSYILVVCAFIFAYPLYVSLKKNGIPRPGLNNAVRSIMGIKWYEGLLIFAISTRILITYFQALIKPVQEIDSIAYRMMAAKIFFMEKGLSINLARGYFIEPTGHKHYPMNISLFSSWIYSSLGSWNDLLVKIIFPTFLLALIIIFYYSMRRIANRSASLFSAYLLLTLPFLIYHSSTSYIDAVVAFYYFASFAYLLLYIRTGKISYFFISALLAGQCTWTKNEGLPLILSNLMVLAVYLLWIKRDSYSLSAKRFMQYLSLILMYQLPWNIFRFVFRDRIPVPEEIPNFLHTFDYPDRIPVMLELFYRKSLFYGNWNIAWFALGVVLLITIIKRRFIWENMFVLFAIVWGLFSYGCVYWLSIDGWEFFLNGTIQNRNFLTFMPLVAYFVCISIFRKENNILGPTK